MDELTINFGEGNRAQGEIVAKVLVNGKLLFKPDYALNIHSFFSAIGSSSAIIEFIGECGIAACCAEWSQAFSTWYSWQWDSHYFSWANVRIVCDELIAKIEALSPQTMDYHGKKLIEELNFYRSKRAEIDLIEKSAPCSN